MPVSVEKLETLEIKVRKLVDLVVELRQNKSQLEQELESTRERLAKHQEMSEGWEDERTTIRLLPRNPFQPSFWAYY